MRPPSRSSNLDIAWQYPLQVIQHQGGYVSLVASDATDPPNQSLAVFASEESALCFMQEFNILGVPRSLRNDREFAWLLESLRDPVNQVAYEPEPSGTDINPRWAASIGELLTEHLTPDNSPWNYPAFVLAVETGFASIKFPDDLGEPKVAIALFTNREKAERCIEESQEGTLCELKTSDDAKRFLTAISDVIDAVAIDPTMEEGHLGTKHCFLLDTLLKKYFS